MATVAIIPALVTFGHPFDNVRIVSSGEFQHTCVIEFGTMYITGTCIGMPHQVTQSANSNLLLNNGQIGFMVHIQHHPLNKFSDYMDGNVIIKRCSHMPVLIWLKLDKVSHVLVPDCPPGVVPMRTTNSSAIIKMKDRAFKCNIKQFPITHAFSITVDKCQGQSHKQNVIAPLLNEIRGKSVQKSSLIVALSRILGPRRSHLLRPLTEQDYEFIQPEPETGNIQYTGGVHGTRRNRQAEHSESEQEFQEEQVLMVGATSNPVHDDDGVDNVSSATTETETADGGSTGATNLDARMPTRTHPDWDTDATYVRNIESVESTGSTGYKDAPLCLVKCFSVVQSLRRAWARWLESNNRVICSAERSLGSLLGLEDTLRPLTTEQGTLRVRSRVVRKSRAAKVQKPEDVVVPRGYKLQPCFTTLGVVLRIEQESEVNMRYNKYIYSCFNSSQHVDGKEVESGAISPGDVVQVRVKMRAYQMEDSAGVYFQPVYIRKMKTLGAAEFAEVENSTGNTAATVVAPSYAGYEF
ncbi:hypothetical protein MP228_001027 [Amoeboaphelidium protococcarum]|nr:hypothetical protein MP228_001027 [Amoeboaphelidium protococcarum]